MKEKEFLQEVKEINLLESTLALTEWDRQTGMPEKATDYRAEQDAYLYKLMFEKSTGPVIREAMSYFGEHRDELSELGQQVYDKVKENYDNDIAIPADRMEAYTRETSKAYSAWIDARKAENFQLFKKSLENLIAFKKEFIPLWRKEEKTPYDVLLGKYEPELTVETLDKVFSEVRDGIIAIRKTIEERGIAPETDFLSRLVSKEQQKEFITKVVEELGYDFSKGRLDDTVHPFMTGFNRNDTRITTRWNENDFKMAVFGIIHEQGHGQYEQNIDPKFDYTPLTGGVSMGIHESQSLFQEIIVGSNRAFWKKQYPFFQEVTQGTFDDIDFETFYHGLKETHANFIRIEADTLTYVLHIIIRYEMEKAIFNENVNLDTLPELWNAKYEEYLGIRPSNDLEGILQDVHWAGGDFGYFPSYALGYMYAAQLKHAMDKDLDFDAVLASDDYSPIKNWLNEKIRQYGASRKPKQLIFDATGEDLNPKYLLDYLRQIYFDVYQVE
ncbi:MAG: carboxypeptidase M32 [Lactobacillales bacterium]|jgi:carboxypeptidase Taq|nr:carboxypeptidase M32 [Lactobacillales bacterium]